MAIPITVPQCVAVLKFRVNMLWALRHGVGMCSWASLWLNHHSRSVSALLLCLTKNQRLCTPNITAACFDTLLKLSSSNTSGKVTRWWDIQRISWQLSLIQSQGQTWDHAWLQKKMAENKIFQQALHKRSKKEAQQFKLSIKEDMNNFLHGWIHQSIILHNLQKNVSTWGKHNGCTNKRTGNQL